MAWIAIGSEIGSIDGDEEMLFKDIEVDGETDRKEGVEMGEPDKSSSKSVLMVLCKWYATASS